MNPSPAVQKVSVAPDVCVVGGAGHVGLPLSLAFAAAGQAVLVYDKNEAWLARIAGGEMPFMEEGAAPLLGQVLKNGRLRLTARVGDLVGIRVVVVTIGTPVDEFLNPTLRTVRECVDELLPYLADDALLVLRSTVYPGVTEWIDQHLRARGKRTRVAFCPERVVQGRALEELRRFPQLVSGTTAEAEHAAAQLFARVCPSLVRMRPIEAELAKLFSNAYRYIQFAVANQFYMMCAGAGVDYYRVLDSLKLDYPRCRDMPGAGFAAGPCLFKDTMQLSAYFGNQFALGHMAMLVNEGLPLFVVENLLPKRGLAGMTVGLLGMAFKADSDDVRSSLSYKLKKSLAFRCKRVLTTDPYVRNDPDLLPLETVLRDSDVLVLCAPHRVYHDLDLRGKHVVDIWNFWQAADSRRAPDDGCAEAALDERRAGVLSAYAPHLPEAGSAFVPEPEPHWCEDSLPHPLTSFTSDVGAAAFGTTTRGSSMRGEPL